MRSNQAALGERVGSTRRSGAAGVTRSGIEWATGGGGGGGGGEGAQLGAVDHDPLDSRARLTPAAPLRRVFQRDFLRGCLVDRIHGHLRAGCAFPPRHAARASLRAVARDIADDWPAPRSAASRLEDRRRATADRTRPLPQRTPTLGRRPAAAPQSRRNSSPRRNWTRRAHPRHPSTRAPASPAPSRIGFEGSAPGLVELGGRSDPTAAGRGSGWARSTFIADALATGGLGEHVLVGDGARVLRHRPRELPP